MERGCGAKIVRCFSSAGETALHHSASAHHGYRHVLEEAEGASADRVLPGDCGVFGLGGFHVQPLAAEGAER